MGIHEVLTAARSPWQNSFAERLVGSIRRECLNHVIVLGERHLRWTLKRYVRYYLDSRSHLSLEKIRQIPGLTRILAKDRTPHAVRRVPTQKPHFDVGARVRERFPATGTPQIRVVTQRYKLHEQYRYVVHF